MLKVYANLSATPASATTVVIYQEGTNDSHVTIGVTSDVLSNIFIRKDIVTAKGDIITASAASTPTRLAVGADGLVLTAQADGSVAWEAGGGRVCLIAENVEFTFT